MQCLPKMAGRTEFRTDLVAKSQLCMQKSASVLRKWIESQDPFRLYPSAFNPKDYRIPMETGVSRKIIFRVWASGTTALGHSLPRCPHRTCCITLDRARRVHFDCARRAHHAQCTIDRAWPDMAGGTSGSACRLGWFRRFLTGPKVLRLVGWGGKNGACANFVTIPGYHGIGDAQTSWVASNKMCPAEKGTAGKEERG